MCNLLRCFKGKPEVFRSSAFPCLDRFRTWHPIEGVIDLDTVQLAGVVHQKFLLREPSGLEDWPPFLVTEPGCSEPNRRHSGIMAQAFPKSAVNIDSYATSSENTAKNGSFWHSSGRFFNSGAGVRIRCNPL